MTVWALWLQRDGFQLFGLYADELGASLARHDESRRNGIPLHLLVIEPLEVHSGRDTAPH